MIELAVLGLFVLALILCICCKASVIFALVFGFFLFFGYGIYKGHGFRAMAAMAFAGTLPPRNRQ